MHYKFDSVVSDNVINFHVFKNFLPADIKDNFATIKYPRHTFSILYSHKCIFKYIITNIYYS